MVIWCELMKLLIYSNIRRFVYHLYRYTNSYFGTTLFVLNNTKQWLKFSNETKLIYNWIFLKNILQLKDIIRKRLPENNEVMYGQSPCTYFSKYYLSTFRRFYLNTYSVRKLFHRVSLYCIKIFTMQSFSVHLLAFTELLMTFYLFKSFVDS